MAETADSVKQNAQLRSLRNFNFVMGFFHLVQGILMIVISREYSLPLTTSFLDSRPGVLQQPDIVGWLRIGPAIAIFLLLSALAHFLVSTVFYDWYAKNLRKGANYARWAEYSLSSSLMIVVIGMLCGMYDLPSLILLFFLNASMILFGHMMELHNQTTKKTNWTAYIFGCIAGLVPWVVMGMYFFGAAAQSARGVPTFVYFIFGTIFVFFFLFAINMPLQYLKLGKWKDYLYGERVYIILSLVAKSALAWQIWGGTYQGG